jgi:cytochrome b pre-mRNA-processing protein 3
LSKDIEVDEMQISRHLAAQSCIGYRFLSIAPRSRKPDEHIPRMKLAKLFRRRDPAANPLYGQIVAQARQPAFYLAGKVPDTVQGRFEMIALHMFLVLHRLKQEGEQGADLAQDLFDLMFQDMDRNLRELGTGDLAVGKRIKTLAKGLYGRIAAYEGGLADHAESGDLEQALARNVFGSDQAASEALKELASYLRRAVKGLAGQPYRDIAAGKVIFAAPDMRANDSE